GQLQLQQGVEGTQDAGSTAHIKLHLIHTRAGLEADTASIEGDAFADKSDGGVVLTAAPVLQYNQLSWLVTAGCDRQQGIHTQFFHLLFFQDLDVQPGLITGEAFGFAGKIGGCTDVARQVAEVARKVHTFGDGLADLQATGSGSYLLFIAAEDKFGRGKIIV